MNTNPNHGQTTEANALAQIAQDATERSEMIYADTSADGSLAVHQTVHRDRDGAEQVDQSTHEYTLPAPYRQRGTTQVTNVESLIQLENRLATASSTSFSDLERRKITTVLNYDGWGDHRISYSTQYTPEFNDWLTHDGQWMRQGDFAELLQDLRHTIVSPPAAEIVQIARTFSATRTSTFESGVRLQSGDVQFSYVEDTKAQSGGTVEVPEEINLWIKPFRDSREAEEVTLEFRYNANNDGLRLGYRIARKTELLERAWAALVEQASTGLTSIILDGPAPDIVKHMD